MCVLCNENKKWVLTKNTWTSEQRGRLWRAIPAGRVDPVSCRCPWSFNSPRSMLLSPRTRLRKRERKRSLESFFKEKKKKKEPRSQAKRKNKKSRRNEKKRKTQRAEVAKPGIGNGIIDGSPEVALGCRSGDSLAIRTRDWQLSADVNGDRKHRPERAHSWSVAARSALSIVVPVTSRLESKMPWQRRTPVYVRLRIHRRSWKFVESLRNPLVAAANSSLVVHCVRPPPLAWARCVVRQVTDGTGNWDGKAFGKARRSVQAIDVAWT